MLGRGNVMKRVINIAMVLILLCVITGCKGNASVSENGKISKNQSEKLEIVENEYLDNSRSEVLNPVLLDFRVKEVIEKAPRFDAIKKGEIEPNGCGECNICRQSKKLTGVFSYKKLFRIDEEEK